MPARSKVSLLPKAVLQDLHLRVIESGFSDYEGHSAWLKSQGHDISHTSVWRYFREVQEEARSSLTALSISTVTARLYAAVAREAGEDYTLAAEHMLQVAQYEGLRNALAQGEISMEGLQEFQKLSQSQRLTRLRAARERVLEELPAATADAAEAVEDVPKRRALPGEVAAALRRALSEV